MSVTELRRKIKKEIDKVPSTRLASLADYVRFLNTPTVKDRIAQARKDFAEGKGVDWRKVRDDV